MRTFFLVLLLAWLVGMVLGAVDVIPAAMLLAGGVGLLVSQMSRQSLAVTTAVGLLVGLGYVYGGIPVQQASCRLLGASSGTIVDRPTIQQQRVQYVVATDGGCTFLVYAPRFPLYGQGSVVELTGGEVQAVSDIDQEYAGWAKYLERRGIDATWRYPAVTEATAMDTLASGPSIFSTAPSLGFRLLSTARRAVRDRVWHVFPEPTASLVVAILLAERGTLPESIMEQFRVTGVAHVLAISGLHISLLAGLLFVVVSLLPVSPLLRMFLLLLLLWSYIIFLGAPVSATRAGFFWSLTLLALNARALVSLPTVLLLTATAMVTYNPGIVEDVGFQLSISAVAGIFLALFLTPRLLHQRFRGSFLLNLVLVSLGASLATWPLIAYHFKVVSFVSVLANLLVVPAVPLVLGLSIVALGLSLLSPFLALLAAWPVDLIFRWMEAVTHLLSIIPGAFIEEVVLPFWVLPVYYAGLLLVIVAWLAYQGRPWREVWAP